MPAVCRGDMVDADVVHCSQPLRLARSDDVIVNGIGYSREGDVNHPHLLPGAPCPTHQAPIAAGSSQVFANGKGIGRIGDRISACTFVATGSPDTFDGSPEG